MYPKKSSRFRIKPNVENVNRPQENIGGLCRRFLAQAPENKVRVEKKRRVWYDTRQFASNTAGGDSLK